MRLHASAALLLVVACTGETSRLEPSSGPPAGLTEAAWGELLYTEHACAACHPINGARGVGGRLDHRFGLEAALVDGTEVPFDEDYVRESILTPEAKRAATFEAAMPNYADILDAEQVDALIAFVASLR